MKIQKLEVSGFRSLKNIMWEPGNLNVVIGPNGSGKSNLLRTIEMMTASTLGQLYNFIINEGGIASILWNRESENVNVSLIASNHLPSKLKNAKTDLGIKLWSYSFTIIPDPQIIFHVIGQEKLTEDLLFKDTAIGTYETLTLLNRNALKTVEIYDESSSKLQTLDDFDLMDETLLSAVKHTFSRHGNANFFQARISLWRVYHYLSTTLNAPIRQPSITKHEPQIATDGSNLVSVLHTLYTDNMDFRQNLNNAMNSAFEDDFSELFFPPASDNKIQLRIKWKSLSEQMTSRDISDGTLRFLFLITILANPNPPPLIAIDEPETGLHPSMMPIIADFAVQASERTQVIITTHSADFLDAFHDVTPTITITECVNGETKLRIPSEEKLKEWLKNYKLGEIYRMRELEDM